MAIVSQSLIRLFGALRVREATLAIVKISYHVGNCSDCSLQLACTTIFESTQRRLMTVRRHSVYCYRKVLLSFCTCVVPECQRQNRWTGTRPYVGNGDGQMT